MGFYIKKSFSFGGVRFNISKSGIGTSVGVKGFRLGGGPRGNYIHMGRHGIYYRAALGKKIVIRRKVKLLHRKTRNQITVCYFKK